MSEGDFEVHQIGAMEEIRVVRQFSRNIIDISYSTENQTEKWEKISSLVRQLEKFYAYHAEKYPTC